MIKTKSKILIIILALIMAVFGGYIASTAQAKASTETGGGGIITVSPGSKAEDGKLSFRFWINKKMLSDYVLQVPLTHTYLNVLINDEIQPNLAYCVEGFQYVNWQYNVSEDADVGYGMFEATVDVSQRLNDKVKVVFGFTTIDNSSNIYLFSDEVSYVDVFNTNNRIEDLKIQINFLESELARLNAESITNYKGYEEACAKLESLQAEYDALSVEYSEIQRQEKIKAWGVLITSILVASIALSVALIGSVKIGRAKKLNAWVKLALILLILGAVATAGYFGVSEVLPIFSAL